MILLLDANLKNLYSETVAQRCSVKKVFSELLQNSQENTCARASFLIKKRLWYRCFPVNFAKFIRTPFHIKHLRWLLLFIDGAIPLRNFEKKCSIVNKRVFLLKFSELQDFSPKGGFCKKRNLKAIRSN